MPLSHAEARTIMAKLLPLVESESSFLGPCPSQTIDATEVFTALREACDPPMTAEEFNAIADQLEQE